MYLLELASRILKKRASATSAPTLPRQDVNLPYNAHLGALMDVPRSSFAVLDRTLLRVPDASQVVILAASRLRLADTASLEVFRLYANTGHFRTGHGQSFLQVLMEQDTPREATFYQHLFRITPTTPADQEPYLGRGFGLGELTYNMGEDQLALCGLPPEAIQTLLDGSDALSFQRDGGEGDYITPYQATETRLDDAEGMTGLRQTLKFMPYSRELPNGRRENLMISFIVVDSVNGLEAPAVHIDFHVGLTLEPLKLKVTETAGLPRNGRISDWG